MGEKVKYKANNKRCSCRNVNYFFNQLKYFFFFCLADNITYHGIGSRSKCPAEYTEKSQNIPHSIGYTLVGDTGVSFNQYKEKIPAYDTDCMLKHEWCRHGGNQSCIIIIPAEFPEE